MFYDSEIIAVIGLSRIPTINDIESSRVVTNFGLRQVDTTKSLARKDYVISAILTKLKMKLISC